MTEFERQQESEPSFYTVGAALPGETDCTAMDYVRPRHIMTGGNRAQLLRGGEEAYPLMLEAIAEAKHSVLFEMYIFEDDKTGNRFIDALCDKASKGVTVRVMVDAVGSIGLQDKSLQKLRDCGAIVLVYRPLQFWRKRWGLFRRNHRKIFVMDDKVAFTGGMNITDQYESEANGGGGWLDYHVRLTGPIVAELSYLFHQTWTKEKGEAYAPPKGKLPIKHRFVAKRQGDVERLAARVIHNEDLIRRGEFERAYKQAIGMATRRVVIENAYFLPNYTFRRALFAAIKRGVKVDVLVPSNSDVKVVEYAGRYLHNKLAKNGVNIFAWPKMMHSKVAVIDQTWTTIGSYNIDRRSLAYNLEVAVQIVDSEFGRHAEQRFDADLALAKRYDETSWKAQSWPMRVLCWLAYGLRRWL